MTSNSWRVSRCRSIVIFSTVIAIATRLVRIFLISFELQWHALKPLVPQLLIKALVRCLIDGCNGVAAWQKSLVHPTRTATDWIRIILILFNLSWQTLELVVPRFLINMVVSLLIEDEHFCMARSLWCDYHTNRRALLTNSLMVSQTIIIRADVTYPSTRFLWSDGGRLGTR